MGFQPIPLKRPPRPEPEQRPPQSVSGIIPWGVTMEQAADALAMLAGVAPAPPEPIGDSSDGIAPCGYDEL